jgi:hypothetical protein
MTDYISFLEMRIETLTQILELRKNQINIIKKYEYIK